MEEAADAFSCVPPPSSSPEHIRDHDQVEKENFKASFLASGAENHLISISAGFYMYKRKTPAVCWT